MRLTTLTGLLLVIVPIAFNATFFLVQRAFEYPDILRKPADYILPRFKNGSAGRTGRPAPDSPQPAVNGQPMEATQRDRAVALTRLLLHPTVDPVQHRKDTPQ